ncbi:hypothetical protein LWC34_21590 [Kibdelosporangium philippinense]|uniref:Uncharacterized protein n=1 Tax=Kibdelosporangium philippinense TaxID=211113 RepID=A0ABS8ZC09_9PSEU|nr:hypothetical protein [Kibdelosporangium philippinense]MCE7005401.1 hypothetical protein [Kibdelosporangium philippinense]
MTASWVLGLSVAAVILSAVELIFTSLLVIMALATLWFAGYVVYRLYSDNR